MSSGALPHEEGSPAIANALVHSNFLVTGIVMTFLGPMLPFLAARWGINDALAGRLFLVQFLTSMGGMFASSPLVRRYGYRATFIVGLVLMSTGVVVLPTAPYWLGVIAVGILGTGHGITTPAGNLRTAEINPLRSAAALNVINAVWGIGAMSPSFLLDLARRFGHPAWFLYGTAIALSILLLAFITLPFVPDTRPGEHYGSEHSARLRKRIVLGIGLIFFLYVGAETAFGQWVAMYAHRIDPARAWWTIMPSLFYGALLAGRMGAPVVLKFMRETRVAATGLVIAFLGGVFLLEARGAEPVAAGSLLTGLGLASIFPISVSLFPRWFGDNAGRASGPVFSGGNMGGAMLPWLVGVISTEFTSLRAGFIVPFSAVLMLMVFYLTEAFTGRRLSTQVEQLAVRD